MNLVKDEEMKEVNGGINIVLLTAAISAVIFISGVITGIVNPTRCNN